ncbi:MAG: SusC/RagA family TonB-linked outer membrane protein [Bacteroidales bacterium]
MRRILLIYALITFAAGQMFAQIRVTGQVTNKTGETLPGVNVVIKGTTQGAITDIDGRYTVENIPNNGILLFSFVGMEVKEIIVGTQTTINVVMTEEATSLDEVVVVGYGTVKRANLAGAVTDINAQKLQDIPVVNLSAALEGRLSGVRITIPSGKPGAANKFQIREASTKKVAEEPLYVIDGIIRDKGAFDLLDPSEVEGISILKDASAAVYGAAAAGGVVLVTTKKGKEGKIKINYTSSYGITEAINTTEMLSAYDHAKMLNDGYDILKIKPSEDRYFTEDELLYFRDSLPNGGYNWLDGAWRNSMVIRHSLNFSGGDEKTAYFIGGSYIHETGNLKDLFVKKYSFRSSIQTELFKGLMASVELSISNKHTQTPINSQDKEDDIMEETFRALLQNPKFVPPTINGYPVKQEDLIDNNPYAIWQNNNYSKDWFNGYTATAALNYKLPFINGLSARLQLSQTKGSEYGKSYKTQPKGYYFVTTGGHSHIIRPDAPMEIDPLTNLPMMKLFDGKDALSESTERSASFQVNINVSYNLTFNKHEINALAVCEFSETESNRVGWRREGQQLIENYDMEWAFLIKDFMLSPNRDENGAIGYIGRLNYNFASKYIAEFACRYESSTRFSPENQWGFFPSLLIGWVVSEEIFFKKALPVVNFLKFRGSAGIMGNDNFKSFMYLLRYKPREPYVLFGNQPVNTLSAENGGVVNDKLKWQTSYSYNAGVDMRYFQSVVNFSFDAFYELTENMLDPIGTKLPTTAGIAHNNKVVFNYGRAHSYGYEIELGINKKLAHTLELGINSNLSWAEVRYLKVAQSISAEGKWYDELKTFPDNQPGAICTGIIRTQEEVDNILMDNPNYSNNGKSIEPGMLNHNDLRGTDGSEGPNGSFRNDMGEDRTIIAEHSSPTNNYGISMNIGWKGIRLDMTFNGKFGHMAIYDKEAIKLPTYKANVPAFWKDYWTPENPDATLPRAQNFTMEEQNSTFWMRNGHTLRLTDFSFSYTLPSVWSSKLKISFLRVFFNTKYLWTIINPYDYKDASLSNYNGYPMTRTYNFGININM